ncbi:hypothetical protein BCR43DRAFT_499919 [Syncephalastrum racemosum]|uniref:Uncharacterized protein n=1 Tax=Syncephalastrum racemosum TaxID=13706 RepID=A0A1X2H012_SYNRA|nr:hypothetical protein BCR43DRAFT_499919 [Syncephalastrum racemosum]
MKVPLNDNENHEHGASPPPYTESDTNSAYNPSYLQSPNAPSSSSSAQRMPSAPPTESLYPDTGLIPSRPPLPTSFTSPPLNQPVITQYQQQQEQQQQQRLFIPPQFQAHPSAYQTIPIPPRATQVIYRRQLSNPAERHFPIACLFFLLGWFCPPLWLFGACCCSGSRNRYEAWWGKLDLVMAVLFFITTILVSVFSPQMTDWVLLQASFISSTLLGVPDKYA